MPVRNFQPRFDPTAEFVVQRPFVLNGRQFTVGESFDLGLAPGRKGRLLYDSRMIAPLADTGTKREVDTKRFLKPMKQVVKRDPKTGLPSEYGLFVDGKRIDTPTASEPNTVSVPETDAETVRDDDDRPRRVRIRRAADAPA